MTIGSIPRRKGTHVETVQAKTQKVILDAEQAVRARYTAAAREREPALCCPVEYDPRHLEVIPAEVLERDYGCGDPSRWVREGDTVLDLGSGAGKICFIAAQIAGPNGRVIGIDATEDMLALARKARRRSCRTRASTSSSRTASSTSCERRTRTASSARSSASSR